MLEFHAWPPQRQGGQHVTRTHTGVLAMDTETGVAVYVDSERSQLGNQRLAEQRLTRLVAAVDWTGR